MSKTRRPGSHCDPLVRVVADPENGCETCWEALRKELERLKLPLATEALHITLSQTGADAAVLGATMLAIHHSLSPANIEAMIAASGGGTLRAVK